MDDGYDFIEIDFLCEVSGSALYSGFPVLESSCVRHERPYLLAFLVCGVYSQVFLYCI